MCNSKVVELVCSVFLFTMVASGSNIYRVEYGKKGNGNKTRRERFSSCIKVMG